MVSKVGVASGALITLGSSVMIGGFALLIYAGVMDANNNSLSSMRESATIAFGAIVAMVFGAVIAFIGARTFDENKETQEKAQQAKEAKQPFKDTVGVKSLFRKGGKEEGYQVLT